MPGRPWGWCFLGPGRLSNFFLWPAPGVWKFPSQGWNLSLSSDNAESLTARPPENSNTAALDTLIKQTTTLCPPKHFFFYLKSDIIVERVSRPPYGDENKQTNKPTKNHVVGLRKITAGVPVVAQWLTNPSSIHEDSGSIPSLAQDPGVAVSCGVGCG